ncbi:hypothetical protein POM88_004263 [Heracleum sosnowskyi]|uniref:DUF4218 domain-containing protein n=1 Tax=Heracleum sosnowskyi TaxID=360622 RepID=A0AAD8NEB7_9APIA|nr:hypothetical protein POM88_004263 [Heracleum sosnowskyi]
MLFGTISDFLAYSNLSGYSVKGYDACPLCGEGIDNIRLKHCKKCVYMGHRRWLDPKSRYRKITMAFNGEVEERGPPRMRSGSEVLKEVENLNIQFGKKFVKDVPSRGWKKRSIFFELPYWKDLYVRHFIDLMHVQKNVFDSLIGTLLGVQGKTKDGHSARMDMMDMGIINELAPVEAPGKKPYLPPAAHTLSRKEKKVLLQALHSVKVPEGYSSNINNLVDLNDMKLKGLKSHDFHVIMENLLPIAIRSILPEKKVVVSTTTIVETLYEVEMYFPPSFFDIMVHLTIHLIYETRMCGPAQGCIAERYLIEETIEFWSEFIPNVDAIGLPIDRHAGRIDGEGVTGGQQVEIDSSQWHQVHLCVLHNTIDGVPFVDLHKQTLTLEHPRRGANWIEVEHNRTFVDWLKNHVANELLQNKESI